MAHGCGVRQRYDRHGQQLSRTRSGANLYVSSQRERSTAAAALKGCSGRCDGGVFGGKTVRIRLGSGVVSLLNLVRDNGRSGGIALGERGLEKARAERSDDQRQRQTHDHHADQQLDQRRARLSSPPVARPPGEQTSHHLTAWSNPYMGRITETATNPTAPPTAITSAGSMSAIMFRTL